jgi:hypothetical protein
LLTCKDFLGWLNEYLDESAAAEVRQQVEAHITSCPNCWVIFDTTKKTLKVYKGMEPQPLPSAVHDRLTQMLEKRCASKTNPEKR